MSIYEANQPYGRVTQEDGLVSGAFIGAGIGATAAGGAHMFGGSVAQRVGMSGVNKMRKASATMNAAESRPIDDNFSQSNRRDAISAATKDYNKGEKRLDRGKKWRGNQDKVFGGGWKGKAAAYGGSAVIGGLTGAMID